jgi:hypothetical protein
MLGIMAAQNMLLFLLLFHNPIASGTYVIAQNAPSTNLSAIHKQAENSSQPIRVEEVWTPYLVIIGIITIIATIAIVYFQEKKQTKNTIHLSQRTILREITENRKFLMENENKHITYNTKKGSVNYTNGYLEFEAYLSVLYSGYFTRFSPDTQHYLTMLYSRIKSRNEYITYTERFEDLFFLLDDSQERRERWYKKIESYDLLLTQWEKEILILLNESESRVVGDLGTR